MAFSKRRWFDYRPFPIHRIYNHEWVEDDEATQLVNNILNMYGQCMHNTGGNPGYFMTAGATRSVNYTTSSDVPVTVLNMSLNKLVTGAGKYIRVWVYAHRADGASTAFLRARIGRFERTTYFTAAAGTREWICLTIPIEPIYNSQLKNELNFSIIGGVDYDYVGTETISIRTISVHEWFNHSAPDWIDTTVANCKMGEPDYPHSTGFQRTIARKIASVYGYRMPRCNILQRNYAIAKFNVGNAYGGSEDRFGRYIIRKPQGTTQIDYTLYMTSAVANCRSKVSLYSIDSLAYDNQVTNFTEGAILTGQTSGARARIVRDDDVGATGTLALSPYDETIGTFQNNETIKDDAGGEALANGTNLGQRFVDSDEILQAFPSTDEWQEGNMNTEIIDEDAEYELRIDARTDAGVGDIAINNLTVVEHNGTAVTHDTPNPVRTEQDDDVIASTWQKAVNTLDEIWARRKQILLTDNKPDAGYEFGYPTGQAKTYNWSWNDVGWLGGGYIYPSYKSRKLMCRARIRRSDSASFRVLNVDGGAAPQPSVDQTITGAVLGSTAVVMDTNLAGAPFSGTITIKDITGGWQDNEQLTYAGGGPMLVNGALMEKPDCKVYIKLAVWVANSDTELNDEKILVQLPHDRVTELLFEVPISEFHYCDLADYAFGGNDYPYYWMLLAKTDNLGDYIILEDITVYEEPIHPAGWVVTREDD